MSRVAAVGSTRPLPLSDPDALLDVEIEVGEPGPHDLLVDVRAVSVNPVDAKVRNAFEPGAEPRVLGFDAAGVVAAVGSSVTGFAVGDEVFHAGCIDRAGSNAAQQLVDARIVGHKPRTLDFAEAAALPLTSITAWESLFEKFRLTADSRGTLLVMGAAGGVGSMIVQLVRRLVPGVTIIASASREESAQWARDLGAHHVVDHHRLREEIPAIAARGVSHVFSPFSAGNVETYAAIMDVFGEVVAIDEPEGLELLPLKDRSQTWHWELMFARPLFDPESTAQRDLLDELARLVDEGALRTTMTTRLEGLDATTVRRAHEMIESGRTVGKVVIDRG